MFSWFYWTINVGGLSAIISTNIERYYSFWLAFLVPVTIFTGSIIVLMAGRRRYIRSPPSGSLILRAFRVTIVAIRMRWRLGKVQKYQHILDYAKESLLPIGDGSKGAVTELDQDKFINDLKQAWRACRVFAFYPFYWICVLQLGGNMISQAAQMDVGKFHTYAVSSIKKNDQSDHFSFQLPLQGLFPMISCKILIQLFYFC